MRGIKGLRREEGQASILTGMMMLTFILFFAFVVNTGMLVSAKINLQNAADLAAYAGAATQARQLNQISYLNYEMRRQYKKFLFRYYVVGNMSQKSHPGNPGSVTTGRRVWTPDGDPANDYQVPTVCVIFNRRDNYCQISALGSIRRGSNSGLDAVNTTLNEHLTKLEDLRKLNCKLNGEINQQLLALWLFNTDPDTNLLAQEAANAQAKAAPGDDTAFKAIQSARSLAYGLGLVPKNILLLARINSLAKYVNAAPQRLSRSSAQALLASDDAAKGERSIQAFFSAYRTLGPSTFSPDDIEMQELLPSGSDGAKLLELTDLKTTFDTYAIRFTTNPQVNRGPDKEACEARAIPYSMTGTSPIPVGVKKNPNVLTYYAVKLSAKAKLLFTPWRENLVLKAYAAAQPFGSRIGPDIDSTNDKEFHFPGSGGPFCDRLDTTSRCVGFLPNLPVRTQGDDVGWNDQTVIGSYFQPFVAATASDVKGPEDLERAYQAAMTPTPSEIGRYNIISDAESPDDEDPFIQYFPTKRGIYSFWAPIVASGSGKGSVADDIDKLLKEVVQSKDPDKPQGLLGSTFEQGLQDTIKKGLTNYVQVLLPAGKGEYGEGLNYARLPDPYSFRTFDLGNSVRTTRIQLDPGIFVADQKAVKTSWNEVKDGTYRPKGRTGYSVKFVAFDTLIQGKADPNGKGTSIGNRLSSNDPDADSDLSSGMIQH